MTTTASGVYSFGGLLPGHYVVAETGPAGYLPDKTATPSVSVALAGCDNDATGSDFGVVQPASISGTVYCDTNLNGVLDSGEPLESAASLKLTGTDDTRASVSLTTTSDVNGAFSFLSLRPSGRKRLRCDDHRAVSHGHLLEQSHGVVAIAGSYTVPVTSGAAVSGKTFAEIERGSISGIVFNDVNNNGTQNSGESRHSQR